MRKVVIPSNNYILFLPAVMRERAPRQVTNAISIVAPVPRFSPSPSLLCLVDLLLHVQKVKFVISLPLSTTIPPTVVTLEMAIFGRAGFFLLPEPSILMRRIRRRMTRMTNRAANLVEKGNSGTWLPKSPLLACSAVDCGSPLSPFISRRGRQPSRLS